MTRLTRLAVSAVAVATLGACREAAPSGAFAVRDSSGVQIVSNPATVRGDSGCVAVDTVPALTIGGADAEGPYDLLRVFGALRLADGGVAVLNAGTSELRFFDSTVRHSRTFGRAGAGPGEFRSPVGLLWFGRDTLMVHDITTKRITLLSPAGALLETIGLQGIFGPGLLGRFDDGSFAYSVGSLYRPRAQTGRRRDPAYLVRASRDGAELDTLGSFPGWESFVESDAQSVMATSAPFGRRTSFAVADGRVFVADNAEYRVRVYADGRRLERIIERAHEPVALTPARIEREKKRQRALGSTSPQWLELLERMYQRDQPPATLPAYGDIAVDADGWLWVRAYLSAEDGSVGWDVFDATGRLRCALTLQSALFVREIGHDFLLGVLKDADGVEQVRLYGLRRSAQAPS